MHVSQQIYRELVEQLQGHEGRSPFNEILLPWIENAHAEREWLTSFARPWGDPWPRGQTEDLWRLYALSRVNQVLLLRFQEGSADGEWPGPPISPAEYEHFGRAVGFQVARPETFSPFDCEIVRVSQSSDEDNPIELVEVLWPSLMLGNLCFSRAGSCVRGGRRHVKKELAESTTLYWAYRRKNRPYQDPSHGWGSNSQWRTCFRRDYRIGDELHYNVDGKVDLVKAASSADWNEELTPPECIELLTHRCFITIDKPHDDLYPYRYSYVARS